MLDIMLINANALGYAFEQCLSSDIAITKEISNDADKLNTLKELVYAYNDAFSMLAAEDEYLIEWPINKILIEKVMEATSLADIY